MDPAALWALPLAAALVFACSDGAGSPSAAGGGGGMAPALGGAASIGGSAGTLASPSGSSGGGTSGTGGATGGAAGGGAASTGGSTAGAGTGGSGGMQVAEPITHHVMAIEYPGRLVEISAEGQLLWEHQTPSLAVMFELLPNDHVFYPHGGDQRGAEEVDRDHNVVWSYDSSAGELLGGARLPNGNTLLGEGGPPVVLELAPDKQVVHSIPVTTSETQAHGQIRRIHQLPSGNVLLALEGEGVVRELDPSGSTVWEFGGVSKVHDAVRLANGNTLIGGGDSKRVIEVTSAGEIAWEFNADDAPELGLTWITSVQVLENGDLLVCNWLGADGGTGVHAFQVTREKEVVWKLDNHELLKSATTVTALDD